MLARGCFSEESGAISTNSDDASLVDNDELPLVLLHLRRSLGPIDIVRYLLLEGVQFVLTHRAFWAITLGNCTVAWPRMHWFLPAHGKLRA